MLNNINNQSLLLDENVANKVLSKEILNDLILKTRKGDKKTKEFLVKSNIGLVVNISKKYVNFNLEYADVFQIGCLGLIHAIDKFDPSKDYSFSTYATYWIKSYIQREIMNKSENIRIPIHVKEKQILLLKKIDKLKEKLEREPTEEEILEETNLSKKELTKLLKEYKTLSYDFKFNVQNDKHDQVEFELKDEFSLEDEIIEQIKKQEILTLINKVLTSVEIEVIKLRYGFYDKVLTVREVAPLLNITKSMVSFIEKRALDKLRIANETKLLAIYRDNPDEALNYLNDYKNSLSERKIKNLKK